MSGREIYYQRLKHHKHPLHHLRALNRTVGGASNRYRYLNAFNPGSPGRGSPRAAMAPGHVIALSFLAFVGRQYRAELVGGVGFGVVTVVALLAIDWSPGFCVK